MVKILGLVLSLGAWGFAADLVVSGTSTMEISEKASVTASAPARTHTVDVGNGDHKFKPDVTEAEVGDIVEFRFFPQNHSVVRAEYGYPCIPYEMTGEDKTGFFSGFNAVDKILDDPPKYRLRINDTSPIFFYCSAPGSCIDWGMIGAINPNSSTPLDTQRSLAQNASYMLNPGEPFPAEGSPIPLPSSPSSPSSSPSSSSPSSPPSGHSSKPTLSKGAIAGIVIAALSVCTLAALLFFFIGRSRTLNQEMQRKASTIRTGHHSFLPSSFMPPAYFEGKDSGVGLGGGTGQTHPTRTASHRSTGGTFDISPSTGLYTRTHDTTSPSPFTSFPTPASPSASDTYKFSTPATPNPLYSHPPHAYNSPAQWGTGVPLGPYGRQVQMQMAERGRGREGGALGYWPKTGSRWKEEGLEKEVAGEQEPVEMDASEDVEKGRGV